MLRNLHAFCDGIELKGNKHEYGMDAVIKGTKNLLAHWPGSLHRDALMVRCFDEKLGRAVWTKLRKIDALEIVGDEFEWTIARKDGW